MKKNNDDVAYYSIRANFAEDIFCPANAIEQGFFKRQRGTPEPRFVTADGVRCIPTFASCTNNKDGTFTGEFEDFCQRFFSLSFESLWQMWYQRLGYCDDYWYWIKLERA